MKLRWDIFCTIIDNFGDIGFCWRLARQLVNEHGLKVKLWVDDLVTFSQIEPAIDVEKEQQNLKGVEICFWRKDFAGVKPADVVIEAFACKLPTNYILSMADMVQQPVWINLEYLSAEHWILDCHCLPSFHPYLPLTKYFFFPGFVPGTGGVLLEKELLTNRVIFNSSSQDKFRKKIGLQLSREGELYVSLFHYDDAPIKDLLLAFVISDIPICIFIPINLVSHAIRIYFGADSLRIGNILQSGNLRVCIIPFLEQEEYDRLLWACDINFVRGEDSFLRAQWSGRTFVWNIYPQTESAHKLKLEAFLDLYTKKMPQEMAKAVFYFWQAWNGNGQLLNSWPNFVGQIARLEKYNNKWIEQILSIGDLTSNLIEFSRKDRI
tara:strand:+ start:645 stop:1781 length:1137 start_codon:yes stop_codon:yes gene_type:complete